MATVSVSVKVDKRKLERLIRTAPADASREVRRGTERLRDDVVARMPRRTGKTARATRAVMRGPFEGVVEMPEIPTRFLIEGTRPHVIRGNPLAFMGRGGGMVFVRIVHHPGTRPNDFAERAARAAVSPFQRPVAGIFGGG